MTNTRWRKRLVISVPFTILICLGCGPLKGFSSWHNALQGPSTLPQTLLREQKRNKDTIRCVEQSARCSASRTQCFKPVGLLNRTCTPLRVTSSALSSRSFGILGHSRALACTLSTSGACSPSPAWRWRSAMPLCPQTCAAHRWGNSCRDGRAQTRPWLWR